MSQNMSQPTPTPVYKLVVVRVHDKEYSVRVEGDVHKFAHDIGLYLKLVTNNPTSDPSVEFSNILIVEKGENDKLIIQRDNIKYEIIPTKRVTTEDMEYFSGGYACQERSCYYVYDNIDDKERDKLFSELENILVLARKLLKFVSKAGSGYELVMEMGRFRVW